MSRKIVLASLIGMQVFIGSSCGQTSKPTANSRLENIPSSLATATPSPSPTVTPSPSPSATPSPSPSATPSPSPSVTQPQADPNLPLYVGILVSVSTLLGGLGVAYYNRRTTLIAAEREYFRSHYLEEGAETALLLIIKTRRRYMESVKVGKTDVPPVEGDLRALFRVCEVLKVKHASVLILALNTLTGNEGNAILHPPKEFTSEGITNPMELSRAFEEHTLNWLDSEIRKVNPLFASWARRNDFSYKKMLKDKEIDAVATNLNGLADSVKQGMDELWGTGPVERKHST